VRDMGTRHCGMLMLLKHEGLQAKHAVDSRLRISTSHRYHEATSNDQMEPREYEENENLLGASIMMGNVLMP
jgi:hypothetical protein